MKNQIMYFYNLDINNIVQKNETFYINENYVLVNIEIENELINYYLFNNNYFVVFKNKFNDYYSNINNKRYILIQYKIKNREIVFEDILNPRQFKEEKNNWINKWSFKIDHIEDIINSQKINYVLPYYIGLAENALQLCNDKKTMLYIQHYRTSYKQNLYDFTMPNNIVADTKVRDICGYLKSCFFYNNKQYPKISIIEEEKPLFLARILYPSYMFDLLESENINTNQLNKIINKSHEFEQYINELCSLYNIRIDIEWLKKI